jgi:hypothetical protein
MYSTGVSYLMPDQPMCPIVLAITTINILWCRYQPAVSSNGSFGHRYIYWQYQLAVSTGGIGQQHHLLAISVSNTYNLLAVSASNILCWQYQRAIWYTVTASNIISWRISFSRDQQISWRSYENAEYYGDTKRNIHIFLVVLTTISICKIFFFLLNTFIFFFT